MVSSFRSFLAVVPSVLLTTASAHAQINGTWLGATSAWGAAANWSTTPSIPGAGDTATFTNNGATTSVSGTGFRAIGTMQFDAAAPIYTFTILPGGNLTIGGAGIVSNLSNAPVFNVTSDAQLNFNGGSTAGFAAINNSGAVFFNDGTAGNAIINNNTATSMTIFGGTSTAGNATINNANGFTNFGGTSTAGNAVITSEGGGHMTFSVSSTAGNATIITNSAGGVVFFDSASGEMARFITNGTGLVDISGLTTGGTTAGSIEGDGNYYLGAKTFTVGGNDLDTTVSGIIRDGGNAGGVGGSLVKEGSGTLTLSGVNTYTGATTVNAGTLNVEGSIASSILTTINADGLLTGTGSVGNTLVQAGGIFAPGNGTPGTTMTVSGDLTFQAGAQYVVSINPITSSLANVSGAAMLGGATVNAIYANGSYVDKRYTILTAAGGVSGTFNGLVNTNLPSNFSTSLAYDPNNAYLDLTLNFEPAPDFGGGLNINQRNVANTLVNFFNTTGGIPLAFGALAPAGLTQVSGELATGSQQATFDAMTQFMGVMTDASGAGRNLPACGDTGVANYVKAPRPGDCFAARWNVWVAGYGGGRTTDGNAIVGSNAANSHAYAGVVGADYRISPDTWAGFALAGGGTNFSLANGLGSGRSDLFQAGAFLHHSMGAAYLTGALAYGWQDITTNRTLAIAGLDQLQARFTANAFSGRLEGGYRFASAWGGLTPYAAGQFTSYDLPDYAEQARVGSTMFALNYAGKTVTASRSELGLRTDQSIAMADGVLTLRGRLAWAHNFETTPSIAAAFQTLPGTSFVVNGASIGANSALTTASAEMAWRNGWSVGATFDGEFSDVSRSYTGRGVLRYQW